MGARIYFDHNATTPVRPEIAAALPGWLAISGNPSSVHTEGRAARKLVEDARQAVGALVGVGARQVIFCASGTEANHLALHGLPAQCRLISSVEHDSLRIWSDGPSVPVGVDGLVDLAGLADLLAAQPAPALVSIMLANNETGILQPIPAIAAIVHAAGGWLHCDAVQAPGRVPVDMTALGADLLSLSAHKLGGLKGAAALILRSGLELQPVLRGGGQESSRRAGTEAVVPIAAFGLAATLARTHLNDEAMTVAALRDRLEAGLPPWVRVVGAGIARLPNTSCLLVPGHTAETLVIALDLAGVAVSAGSACSSGKVRRSPVLSAMGFDDALAGAAIRVSLGPGNSIDEVDRFLAILTRLVAQAA